MDCRMNEILERDYNDKNTIIVRNAGANVEGLRRTLQDAVERYGGTEIHVLPHEDCGAMKAVVLKLKDGDPRIGEEMFDSLVRQFKRKYDEGHQGQQGRGEDQPEDPVRERRERPEGHGSDIEAGRLRRDKQERPIREARPAGA